jgi:hypothetical protein
MLDKLSKGERRGRVVVIGDLNGADDALIEILRGTGLIDHKERWIGRDAELVQVGDLFNRGGGARRALSLLLRLKTQARKKGGRVTILLGNHEVMTALGNEAYCTEQEYLAFATAAERKAWPRQVARAARRIYLSERTAGRVLPFEPRLEAWKALHAPGRRALRHALGPRGSLGKALRQLPVVHLVDGMLCVHAGILPKWAARGVDGLNAAAKDEWKAAGRHFLRIKKQSLFRDPAGPLWDRSLARGGRTSLKALTQSLALLGAERMIVGHTPTHTVEGGHKGEIVTRFAGRLVLIDVGLGHGVDSPRTALIIENGRGIEWTPNGTRELWGSRHPKARP